MKTITRNLVILALGIVSTAGLRAGTTTVLEGFEENVAGMPPGTTTNGFSLNFCNFAAPDGSSRAFCNTNFSLFSLYGGRSGAGNVSNWQYTAIGPNDPNVTEGTHSMAITFYAQGFGNDFQLVLSDTNSLLVEQAAAAGQIGRYVLRYDMIFANPSQYVFFNQTAFVGSNWDYLQLSGAISNGLAVFSCALEVPERGLPAPNSGTNVQILFANYFASTQPSFTNCTIYLDNVRLVDTYASPSTKPVIYTLQSFENGVGATNLYPTVTSFYGNPVNARANLSVYTTNGLYNPATNGVPDVYTINSGSYPANTPSPYDSDFVVTDGAHALQVSNGSPANAAYQADFAISFAGTKLAQILSSNLPPSQLAHYTLRWDTTIPVVPSFFDGTYVNMTYSSGAAAFPVAQGRKENQLVTGLQRLTYSTTLDQIAAWGGSPIGGDPAIIFLFDGGNDGTPYFYYYDNFELIDTAPVIAPIVITASAYNPVSHQFKLTWTSTPGATYTVQLSASLAPPNFSALATGIPSGGTNTTTTVAVGTGKAGFFRILEQ
jgi:hypothetical protein